MELVGEEAVADYLHPITAAVLIAKDKVITRSQLQLFKNLQDDVTKLAE